MPIDSHLPQANPFSLVPTFKPANVKQGSLNFARWWSGENLPISSTKAEQTACAGMLK
jgi:hypothetical protein